MIYDSILLEQDKIDAKIGNFSYHTSAHTRYYEKYGFNYIGTGYYPWGDSSRIYSMEY